MSEHPSPSPVALGHPPVAAVVHVRPQRQRGFWTRFFGLPRAWIGAVLVSLVVGGAILAPILAPADPLFQSRDGLSEMGTPIAPNARFPLGTDHLGRDVLSRALYGAQVSLFIAVLANSLAAVFGTLVGVLAGYFSGIIDSTLMRLTDVLLAFPAIILAIGLSAVLRPSITVVIIVVSVISWPILARLVRSQTLASKNRDYVVCARALGATDLYIIIQHILPHVITVTVVWATLGLATTVLIEAALSYLGVGVPPPTPTWGNMIADGQARYRFAAWMLLTPSIAIMITTMGFNLLGDAVRDALDPRTVQRQ
jgi:peptide/nickel transport system permease protein